MRADECPDRPALHGLQRAGRMPHYRARYQQYVAAFMPILIKHGGRLLAAAETTGILVRGLT